MRHSVTIINGMRAFTCNEGVGGAATKPWDGDMDCPWCGFPNKRKKIMSVDLEIDQEVIIQYGRDAGKVGKITDFHMKEVGVKFSDKDFDGGHYRYDNIKPKEEACTTTKEATSS